MKRYHYIFKTGILNAIEYRFNFLFDLLNIFLPVIVEFFVWKSIYSNAASEVINGYTFRDLVIYILVASIVSKSVATGFEDQISGEIRRGELDKYIVKPISYYFYKLNAFVGSKIIQLMFGVPILIAIYLIYNNIIHNTMYVGNILLFIVSICLAALINYGMFFAVACIGFWSSETWGIILAFRITINILSGGVLPLDLLGNVIDKISFYLPFRYTIQFPSEILLNKCTLQELSTGLAIQVISLLVTWVVAQLLWRLGNRKYMAFGG